MNTLSIRVEGQDQIGETRRAATACASRMGFDETATGRIALVATECASNIWKHAGSGEVLLNSMPDDHALEILALDNGPGIADIERSFQDGYSTAGSPGTGLGAIRRLSTETDIYSIRGKGTAILARIRKPGADAVQYRLQCGGISVPKRGEEECGDGYALHADAAFCTVLVVDGLGHGPFAHQCAVAAEEAFRDQPALGPAELMQDVHARLRATRGAAVSIARLDFSQRTIRYSGIGNVTGIVSNGRQSRQMLSHPGIVGADVRNVRELTYEWRENDLVLIYSDGIGTHWSLDAYEGLSLRDCSLIAGVLYRDWTRGRDDATMVVIRERVAA